MRFRNTFDVPLPPEEAWLVLMDIHRIAPCMPGAALTGQVNDTTYKGTVAVRLGPVALGFVGTAMFQAIDADARTAAVKASGSDAKGRGGANALVSFAVTPADAGSRIIVDTDLSLSGSIAQYGRAAGMIQEVAAQLIKQFASSLRAHLEAEPAPMTESAASPAEAPVPAAEVPSPPAEVRPIPIPAKPISGFSLMLKVLWRSLARLFGRRSEA